MQPSAQDGASTCRRLASDLAARRAVFDGTATARVPVGGLPFWTWFKSVVNPSACTTLVEDPAIPPYPATTRDLALWHSGGCESTYSLHVLYPRRPELLRMRDFPVFQGEHRRIGQIHFLCAALGANLGYRETCLGVERNDLLFARLGRGGRYVERSPDFLDAWSGYLGDRKLTSVCRAMPKEEILVELDRLGLGVTGTCDVHDDGTWCGCCFKCYEAFYTAKAVGLQLPIPLSRAAFERFHGEYRAFIDSGYRMNFNNAQQGFLRLQVLYGLAFEPDADCATAGQGAVVLAAADGRPMQPPDQHA